MNLLKKILPILLILRLSLSGFAQQVLMQGFYYDIPKAQCGAAWADTLANKAAELSAAGFTHIWAPPFQGNGPNSGGYDPRDLYIGENTTLTALGTKQQIVGMVSTFSSAGIDVVGDMIYNHRDGGAPENNNPVLDYIINHAGNTISGGYQYPMPSDRYRMVLPIGSAAGNGEGNYYINVASWNSTYAGSKYMLYVTTEKIGGSRWSPVVPTGDIVVEGAEPALVMLGKNYEVTMDFDGDNDEFQVSLNPGDFNPDDQLVIYLININPVDIASYSNHRPWKIWYDPLGSAGNGAPRDLADAGNMFQPGGLNDNYKLRAQTYTNFCGLPGGGPCMNGENFRPNWSGNSDADVNSTLLGPPYSQQSMDYFYDYDHQNPDTKQKLIDWTLWSWDQVGIRGLRMDAIKHFPASFVGDLLCAMHAAGKDPSLIVGEWYGQDPSEQGGWLTQVYEKLNACGGTALSPKVFDFNLRDALKKASDGGNGTSTSSSCEGDAYDVRGIFDESLHNLGGFNGNNVVTMANNHDFRSEDPTFGNSLIHSRSDALNSYAYMLTNNQLGVPTIFWPDYYGYNGGILTWDGTACNETPLGYFPVWPEGGLKSEIDELISVLKTYIQGSSGVDYLNKFGGPAITYYQGCYKRSLIYQNKAEGSAGNKEVLNVVNFGDEDLDADIPIIIRNDISAGDFFTKVAGQTSTETPTLQESSLRVKASAKVAGQSSTEAITLEGSSLRVKVPAHSFAVWVQGDPIPLPVNLISFRARPMPTAIELNWEATRQTNFSGYTVQRSTDAKEFTDLGWVEAFDGANGKYSFGDNNVTPETTFYYRLKMIDQDGSYRHSNIVHAKIDLSKLVTQISPNPADTKFELIVNNPRSGEIRVNIFDMTGRRKLIKIINRPEISKNEIDISTLSSGMYVVQVSDGQTQVSSKLLVK